jgi:hypothetical protein
VITGIAVPLEVVAVLCVTFAVLGGWAGRHYTLQRLPAHGGPAPWAERPPQQATVIAFAAHPNAAPETPRAVLLGRISVMSRKADVHNADTMKQVADVLRASLRRDDRVTIREGATFSVEIDGTDEGVAAKIAQRLRDAVARLRFPHGRGQTRFSANFGVAAGHGGIAGDVLIRRAREALGMALHDGEEHIVKASEIEEIRLLPPPDPAPLASAA